MRTRQYTPEELGQALQSKGKEITRLIRIIREKKYDRGPLGQTHEDLFCSHADLLYLRYLRGDRITNLVDDLAKAMDWLVLRKSALEPWVPETSGQEHQSLASEADHHALSASARSLRLSRQAALDWVSVLRANPGLPLGQISPRFYQSILRLLAVATALGMPTQLFRRTFNYIGIWTHAGWQPLVQEDWVLRMVAKSYGLLREDNSSMTRELFGPAYRDLYKILTEEGPQDKVRALLAFLDYWAEMPPETQAEYPGLDFQAVSFEAGLLALLEEVPLEEAADHPLYPSDLIRIHPSSAPKFRFPLDQDPYYPGKKEVLETSYGALDQLMGHFAQESQKDKGIGRFYDLHNLLEARYLYTSLLYSQGVGPDKIQKMVQITLGWEKYFLAETQSLEDPEPETLQKLMALRSYTLDIEEDDIQGFDNYLYSLWLLSFAVLSRSEPQDISDSLRLRIQPGEDRLLDLISREILRQMGDVEAAEEWPLAEQLLYPESFHSLLLAIENQDPNYLHQYVQEWYGKMARASWHDNHSYEELGEHYDCFVGYWSWEGALVAALFSLDDSPLKAHQHYPWDLAHPSLGPIYARVYQSLGDSSEPPERTGSPAKDPWPSSGEGQHPPHPESGAPASEPARDPEERAEAKPLIKPKNPRKAPGSEAGGGTGHKQGGPVSAIEASRAVRHTGKETPEDLPELEGTLEDALAEAKKRYNSLETQDLNWLQQLYCDLLTWLVLLLHCKKKDPDFDPLEYKGLIRQIREFRQRLQTSAIEHNLWLYRRDLCFHALDLGLYGSGGGAAMLDMSQFWPQDPLFALLYRSYRGEDRSIPTVAQYPHLAQGILWVCGQSIEDRPQAAREVLSYMAPKAWYSNWPWECPFPSLHWPALLVVDYLSLPEEGLRDLPGFVPPADQRKHTKHYTQPEDFPPVTGPQFEVQDEDDEDGIGSKKTPRKKAEASPNFSGGYLEKSSWEAMDLPDYLIEELLGIKKTAEAGQLAKAREDMIDLWGNAQGLRLSQDLQFQLIASILLMDYELGNFNQFDSWEAVLLPLANSPRQEAHFDYLKGRYLRGIHKFDESWSAFEEAWSLDKKVFGAVDQDILPRLQAEEEGRGEELERLQRGLRRIIGLCLPDDQQELALEYVENELRILVGEEAEDFGPLYEFSEFCDEEGISLFYFLDWKDPWEEFENAITLLLRFNYPEAYSSLEGRWPIPAEEDLFKNVERAQSLLSEVGLTITALREDSDSYNFLMHRLEDQPSIQEALLLIGFEGVEFAAYVREFWGK